jgi:hypothetical protein
MKASGTRAVVAALLLGAAMVRAQPEPPSLPPPTEYEVKAAFLYNFTRFVAAVVSSLAGRSMSK